jgi:lipoprotein-releasing system ATP-binding protein|tara:strand:+ start:9310 stop:9957 length:648 start_codon:yes stop_codon:yes gene_type:complete
MISVNNLKFSYDKLEVLKGIDLRINKGEIVSIMGPSGAGKTSLLQLIGTLEKPNSGSILINDINPNTLKEKDLAIFRNLEIGFIFQFHNLLSEFTAFENICIPGYISNDKKNVEKKALELIKTLGLEHRKDHMPNELSGGEKQRVAVARALINSPAVILADEPTGNLDSENSKILHDLFIKLNKELNQTFIIVTHNKELANQTNRVINLVDGKII